PPFRSSAKERSVAVRKACVETTRRPAGATGLVPAIADSVPKSWRTAFRCGRQSVRHPDGTLSAMPPEWCPPSVRNPVRHGPERAQAARPFAMPLMRVVRRRGSDVPASRISVQLAPKDFRQWDHLLNLLQAAFAYQEHRVDPPSSVYTLDAESLAEKSCQEHLFLARIESELAGCVFARDQPPLLHV